ncbi:MAG: hypothetical protein Q7O12_10610 [Deltaproteobacteria bacterium]|nr:hypothetical protein [Deltaproteobacteria bacterium]
MKKFLVFAVVLALLVPSMALGAAEFSLGGFIKLDAMWDSDSGVHKNNLRPPARTNDPNRKHGRLLFTAQGSRFNFTIKGPKLWGAQVTGFLEMDFDSAEAGVGNVAFGGASHAYTPRLRHAMFRFNWPTSELLFGQYWSFFSEWWAESAEDGPLMMTGTPTARLAQIRFTQKFQDFTVAAMIGDPNQTTLGANVGPYVADINNGRSAETPQLQAKVNYSHDFWGKAAYYGKPTPFTIQFSGGWQRSVSRASTFTVGQFGENNYQAAASIRVRNQYLNPWLAMGSLFIPVIPTHSANLAGTASILTQWWIGQGVETFGFAGVSGNNYRFNSQLRNGNADVWNYDAELLNKFGGFVEGQYYFNNQWFVNALYGISKTFNVNRAQWIQGLVAGRGGMEMGVADNASTIQQVNVTLWYRPIQAIKFGLQYGYSAANYPQLSTSGGLNVANTSNFGDNHRVEFVGFFYF